MATNVHFSIVCVCASFLQSISISLTFAYHRAILAALSLTPDIVGGGGGGGGERGGGGGGRGGVGRHVLVVGLGGGALPTFIHLT